MVYAGGNGADFRGFQPGNDLFGVEPRRQVDVVDRKVKQFVADRATDVARQSLVGAERVEQPGHPAAPAPFGGVQLHDHCSLRERLTITAAVAPQILRPFQTIS